MGASAFNYVQYGKETNNGTAVAATKRWPGTWQKLPSDVKKVEVAEMMDVRAAARRTRADQKLFRSSLISPNATFQQLIPVFGCGLKGGVTATETTPAQGDYDWAFTPAVTTTSNAPDSLTVELGNSEESECREVEYCMFDKITIGGSIDQEGGECPVNVEASFFGRQLSDVTKTAAIGQPSGTFMNAKKARLYLDTSWAGVGGTEIANLLRSFQIEILTGLIPDATGSANEYFNAHKESIFGIMGTFTIEGGSNAWTIFDNARSAGLVVARLKVVGPQIGSGVNHQLQIDFSGDYMEVSPLDSEDRGRNLATFAVNGLYDPTGAKLLQCSLITDTNAY